MSKNEYVSLDTIVKICYALDCGIEDVIEVVIERQENQ
jgi:putative transcriptional regulator